MRVLYVGLLLAAVAPLASTYRANFLRVRVTAASAAAVRAIWRPYAGAVSSRGEDQQAALGARRRITHPDSARRWRDPAARDTVTVWTPAEFIVDMAAGPVVVEAVGRDSVRVEAHLSPRRGRAVAAWGQALRIESDGITPRVRRRR